MGLRVEQGILRSTKRIMRLVPYESPAFRRGENVNPLRSLITHWRAEYSSVSAFCMR